MEKKKRLGELLVEGGLVTQEKLDLALKEHPKSGQKLGQYLINQGMVSDGQIVNLLSEKLNLEKYRPGKYPVDMALIKILSLEIAQKYQVAPVELQGGLLKVVMLDPMDINALDNIENVTNCEVEPLICTERELKQLISSTYGLFSDIDGVLESIEDEDGGGEISTQTEEHIQISSLQNQAEEAPIIRLVNSIISQGVREGASDLHISPKDKSVQIRFRIDGKLHEVPSPSKSLFMSMVTRVKILAKMDISNYRTPQDGRFSVKVGHREIGIRASTIPTIYGENLVLRLLDKGAGIFSLDKLGIGQKQQNLIEQALVKPYGMILCTGPTGSGKSSTLFAMLNKINRPDIHIITVEDPVEYRIENVRQVQLNTKAGMTFASGLRSILRQDPDVIMVGEIRDAETANIAVQASLTGHRVLSTLHTNDSAGAVTRLHDMGVKPFLVSSVMLISIAQRLVRTNCTFCLEPYKPSTQAINLWGEEELLHLANFQRGIGCQHCLDIGYKGRIGIYEVLSVDESIQKMILEGKTSQEISASAIAAGNLCTLKQAALEKVIQGVTTLEEAASAVMT